MTGDLVLDLPDADSYFDASREFLQGGDLTIGHVEVPHTTRGTELVGDVPAPASDPENLKAMGRAGFDVATLAGNHVADSGPEGIEDTIANLRDQGIATCGAGANLAAARAPAVVERDGRKVAVLSYNCVGPKDSWAAASKAGCAYVRILTHYELEMANPGGPPEIYTFAEPRSLEAMQADVEEARGLADIVIVAFHKGTVHTPAVLVMYERPVARAAVEAGADIVIGHHAHILRGIEFYKGRPIFHGLGNFVTVTNALSVNQDHPARREWAIKRKQVFGFEPDPDYPAYPFHPEAKNAVVAECRIDERGVRAGFRPFWIAPSGQPRPAARGGKGDEVVAYMQDITRRAGLNASLAWDGDWVTAS
jgi:poly-gamma-glutamate synthesis protein (capsule biosynthesis protein)